jgi:hypothetical protein
MFLIIEILNLKISIVSEGAAVGTGLYLCKQVSGGVGRTGD